MANLGPKISTFCYVIPEKVFQKCFNLHFWYILPNIFIIIWNIVVKLHHSKSGCDRRDSVKYWLDLSYIRHFVTFSFFLLVIEKKKKKRSQNGGHTTNPSKIAQNLFYRILISYGEVSARYFKWFWKYWAICTKMQILHLRETVLKHFLRYYVTKSADFWT